MNEFWSYPAGPVTNSFGSHPGYDEAHGPFDPSGDDFVPIEQFSAEEAQEEFNESGESDDEPVAAKEPPPAVFQVHATSKLDSGLTLLAPPVVVTKLCLKEPDPRKRGWRKVPTYPPLTT